MSNSEETENKTTEKPEITEKPEATTATASVDQANKLLDNAMGLKESNPKVFFGAIAALAVVVLIVIMMSSGSKNTVPHTTLKTLTIGQQYSLKGANSLGGNGSISMVANPDTVSAFDDSQEKGVKSPCKQQPEGTVVKVLDLTDYVGKKNSIAQIEILSDGECKGRKGWTLVVDIQ
ncbi:MAG: hypothetical protein KAG06_00895 [Methylococcales bacterium]|nr:hypothetical protein [Methylococcales bacterium]